MKLYLVLLITLILSGCASAPQKRTDKLSILQGLTSTREVEFSILGPVGKNLKFELRSEQDEVIAPDEIKVITRSFSPWVVYKMVFVREQEKDYNLYVYEDQKVIDQRLVGKGQLNQSKLKLAVVSCVDDTYEKNFHIWNVLAQKNPEYVLMIGDNVYADKTQTGGFLKSTPETIWERYTETRLTVPFYFQEKLIPVHALWDDHDLGANDANINFEYVKESAEVFDAFWAQSLSDEAFTKGHGVGGLLSMGDFNLYFLDARSFRDANKDGRHLGSEQYQWLMKDLKDETQPSLIIKGDQFFGAYHSFESYEGNHPNDFDSFVADLKALSTPFVFLSGDRHMSEIMQFPRSLFGMPSFEITSSPMHARVFPPKEDKNPWRVVSVEGQHNFTIIENLARDNHWFLDVESIGESGEVFYRRELAVYIKDLQDNLKEVKKRRSGKRRYRKSRGRRR